MILTANGASGTIGLVIYVIAIIGVLYFFMIRPQRKEQKNINAMLSTMQVGDCVVTTSGFYGIVIDIEEEEDAVIVEFGNNKNCRIAMKKAAIAQVEKAENAK